MNHGSMTLKGLLTMCLFIFFIAFFSFVSPSPAFAGTFYINAVTGDDTTGNGSELAPWKTLGKAFTSVPNSENNTVYIAEGTYDQEATVKQQSMEAGFTTTFQAQGAVTVQVYDSTINGGTGAMLFANGAGNYVFKGSATGAPKTFVVDLQNTGDGGTGSYSFIIGTSGSANITLEDMEIKNGVQVGYPQASGSITCRRCYLHDFTSSYGPIRTLGTVVVESSFIENWGQWSNFGSGLTKWVNNTFYAQDTNDYLYIPNNTASPTVTIQNNIFIYGGSVTDTWRPIYHRIDADINWNVSNNLAWKVGTLSSPRDIKNYPALYNYYKRDNIVNNFISVDPLLLNPETSPEISDTSLAVGRGTNTGVLTDFAGQSFTENRHDIGAWAVGDSATKQYISVTTKKAMVVGDSYCDSHSYTGDDFDESLMNHSYFSDWDFIRLPGTIDSICFTGRRLSEMAGPLGEFMQSDQPEAIFMIAGYNDRSAGYSATWVINQVEEYEQMIADLTNDQMKFIYTTQPDNGCTPTTTVAEAIEDGATFNTALNIMRFISDNIWSTYYNCPTDGVHPILIGYDKMAQYAAEAFIYNYATPFVMGTDNPDLGASTRIFGTGKFRSVNNSSGTTVNLQIVPESNDLTQYLDLSITKWETSGSFEKQWTETSDSITGDVLHTVGDLEAGTLYVLKVDGVQGADISSSDCTNGLCTANSSGELSFTYTGGYSTHTFSITEYVASGATSSSNSPSKNIPSARTCTDSIPVGQPDLFQVDRTGTKAKLYFTPINDNVGGYNVIFGHFEGDERFGGIQMVSQNENKGVQSITVDHLDSNSNYAFKVISTNGCATGEWSNWLVSGKLQAKRTVFYRYWDKIRNFNW